MRATVVGALLGILTAFVGPGGSATAEPSDTTVGDVTGFAADGAVYRLTAGQAEARVSFVTADTFRIELAPDGRFTDPTGTDIVTPQGPPPATHWARHVRLRITDTNGSKSGDHGDWAAARFTCA